MSIARRRLLIRAAGPVLARAGPRGSAGAASQYGASPWIARAEILIGHA